MILICFFEHGLHGLTRILYPFYPRNPCSLFSVIQGRQFRSIGQNHNAPTGRQNILFDGATHPDCRCSMVRHTPPLCGTPLREGWSKAGVCCTIRSNCDVVNKNEGRGCVAPSSQCPTSFFRRPSGLFYCVSFPAGVELRSTLACTPSPFQGPGFYRNRKRHRVLYGVFLLSVSDILYHPTCK